MLFRSGTNDCPLDNYTCKLSDHSFYVLRVFSMEEDYPISLSVLFGIVDDVTTTTTSFFLFTVLSTVSIRNDDSSSASRYAKNHHLVGLLGHQYFDS